MKLSKEEIQFINTYLKNSGVIYVDIRLEMIDHVASAIEEKTENISFYDAFKEYMAQNKKELLSKNEKPFLSWEIVLPFLRFLVQPIMLVFGVLWYFISDYFHLMQFDILSKNFAVVIILVYILQWLYIKFVLRKRIYFLEKSWHILGTVYVIRFFFYVENSPIICTFFYFLLIGFVIYFIKRVMSIRQHRFNYI